MKTKLKKANPSNYRSEVIAPGDLASQIGREVCKNSIGNSLAVHVVSHDTSSFRGGMGYLWKKHILLRMLNHKIRNGKITDWNMMETVENDGAGGKPQFPTFLGSIGGFYRLGWELVVMCAEDVVRRGGFPCIMLNQADIKNVNKRNLAKVRAFFRGYSDALKSAGLVNITGETAIMKNSITAFCDTGDPTQLILTLSGACVGLLAREKMFESDVILPEMPIVGLFEDGYRCNGGGAFTRIIQEIGGIDMKEAMKDPKLRAFVRELTVSSRYYGRTITRIHGWCPDGRTKRALAIILAIAHITGGGIWVKFGEMLPKGIGAELDKMPLPPKALRMAFELSKKTRQPMSEWNAYGDFHGGPGMILVCEPGHENRIIEECRRDGIRAGVIGKTTSSKQREVTIISRYTDEKTFLSSLNPF